MILTIADVRSWNPDALAAAGDDLEAVRTTIDTQLRGVTDTVGRLDWLGPAGNAAAERVATERHRAGRVQGAVGAVAAALRQHIADLRKARGDLLREVDHARRDLGFEVDEHTNAVTATITTDRLRASRGHPITMVQLTLDAVAEQAQVLHLLGNAEAAAGAVRTALHTAMDDPGFRPFALGAALGNPAPIAWRRPLDYTGANPARSPSRRNGAYDPPHRGVPDRGDRPDETVSTGEMAEWIQRALDILRSMGYDTDSIDPADIATIIDHESGGNPHAVNDWDENATAGHPSKGLMQCVDSTFEAYAAPGHTDIWNPVDNIVAGVRYSIDRYGSVAAVPGVQAIHSGAAYLGY